MSVPELYGKNCLGDVATVYNPEKKFGFFSLLKFNYFAHIWDHLRSDNDIEAQKKPGSKTIFQLGDQFTQSRRHQ